MPTSRLTVPYSFRQRPSHFVMLFGILLFACCGKSPVSPSASARFVTVGDLELARCADESCDQFSFLLRNVGNACASTINFDGTVTLAKSSGVTSTANWRLESYADRLFKPGETRRAIQYRGVLLNPPGPHTYSVNVNFGTPLTCD